MKSIKLLFIPLLFSFMKHIRGLESKRPNIVLIVADDLGWNDVSFHGSRQFITPNIDVLANTGLAFERYYTHCVCSPSRTALLTGKYPYTLGMQGFPIKPGEDRGIPTTEKLLPQYLKELGYKTHLVGKWHVGSSRTRFLPTSRGFDTHFGHREGTVDYYQHDVETQWPSGKFTGLTLFRNNTPVWDQIGYLTDVYTDETKKIIKSHDTSSPMFLMLAHAAAHSASNVKNAANILQAPPEQVRFMRHIVSPERRTYAAVVKKLDESIGEVFEALYNKGILNDTIIVIVSDNGAMTIGSSVNYGLNLPLRGEKLTPFEGGVRVPGLIWTLNLTVNRDYNKWAGYMHVTDWLPTLLQAAGGPTPKLLDGFNQWNNLVANYSSSRNSFYEINDDPEVSFESVTHGKHKLIVGGRKSGYYQYLGKHLLDIKGNAPSYDNALANSKVFKLLQRNGHTYSTKDFNLSNQMKVKCPKSDNVDLNDEGDEEYFKHLPKGGDTLMFDIKKDPCETTDLSDIKLKERRILQKLLSKEKKRVKAKNLTPDINPAAYPGLHNHTWTTWADQII